MSESGSREAIVDSIMMLEALTLSDFVIIPRQMVQTRDDQVRNNAGGYVFEVDDLTKIRRFLILGTSGAKYYVSEEELTMQNIENLKEIIRKGKGGLLLREIIDISLAGRAPKQGPLLFALALCARFNVRDRKSELKGQIGDWPASEIENIGNVRGLRNLLSEDKSAYDTYLHFLQQSAFKAVNKVCRIPTHLFTFAKYCEMVSRSTGDEHTGWGKAMRKCISEWYLQKSPKELAMHITKYKNREGYTHRDLLRLAHPMASQNKGMYDATLVYDQLFHFACTGNFDESKTIIIATEEMPTMKRAKCDYHVTEEMVKYYAESEALKFIKAVMEVSGLKNDENGRNRCVELIRQFGLVREHIPTDLLNDANVWAALLVQMPMTALIRNLSKLSCVGLLDEEKEENKKYVDMVVAKILDQEAIHKARIHPISVLLAASVFTKGHGVRGSLKWAVNERVKKALDECFLLAFKNVVPTNKRYCLALDVSGSMTSPINGGVLSCRDASAAMASVFLKTEQHVECVAFDTELVKLPFTRESSLVEMVEHIEQMGFGATDCAQPMIWAQREERKFDVFIVYTDSETWAGDIQPFQAIKSYRQKMDILDAKLVVMGMASNGFSIADPSDPGMIDIVGLDASIPELLRGFVLNEF